MTGQFFFLLRANPASFIYFRLFKHTPQFLRQINVKKCPSSIWCWDLNSRPLEYESPPITIRPGLPPDWPILTNSSSISFFFKKVGHSRPLFSLYFRLFNNVDSKQYQYKICRWLDSNRRPLVSEATALPTEPQPRPLSSISFLPSEVRPPKSSDQQFYHFVLKLSRSNVKMKLISVGKCFSEEKVGTELEHLVYHGALNCHQIMWLFELKIK